MDIKDRNIIRDLAKQYSELSNSPVENKKRDLWCAKNSFKLIDPLIYIRAFAWHEMPAAQLETVDPLCRRVENFFRSELFRASFDDDYIFEPWYTVNCSYINTGWGVEYKSSYADDGTAGACKFDYPIKDLSDFNKMRPPVHEIDEVKTKETFERTRELIGDILTVNLNRGPCCHEWTADISCDLGKLRGMENFMLDMYDNPEWLHGMLDFMSKGIQENQAKAEENGDIGLTFSYNQAMAYAEELQYMVPNINGVKRSELWGFAAAQEYALVSPEMHDEFLFQYQIPILKNFGLVAYGCCEDLSNKIDMLRQLPNLRRIAVSPFADVRKCVEQIGTDYIISYRPSPADMVSYGFDEGRIRKILKRDLEILKGTYFDITLKDVETVEKDPVRIQKWVSVCKEVISEVC